MQRFLSRFEALGFLNIFVAAFCFKQGIPLLIGGLSSVILACILIFLGIWALSGRLRRVSIALLTFQTWIVLGTWPWTINHRFLELYLSVILVVLTFRNARGICVVKELQTSIIILEVGLWTMAALHKIVHGFYLNGSMFLFWQPITMLPLKINESFQAVLQEQTAMGNAFRLVLSYGTILMELLAAGLCLIRRKWAVIILLGLQYGIAFTSGEWDFACLNLLCLAALDERVFRAGWTIILLSCSAMTMLLH